MTTQYDANRDGPSFGTLDLRTITDAAHRALAERIRHAVRQAKIGPIVTLHIEEDGSFAVWTRHPRRFFDVYSSGSVRDGVLRLNGKIIEEVKR